MTDSYWICPHCREQVAPPTMILSPPAGGTCRLESWCDHCGIYVLPEKVIEFDREDAATERARRRGNEHV